MPEYRLGGTTLFAILIYISSPDDAPKPSLATFDVLLLSLYFEIIQTSGNHSPQTRDCPADSQVVSDQLTMFSVQN